MEKSHNEDWSPGTRNNRIGVTIKPLLPAEIGNRRIHPNQSVSVTRDALELICFNLFVAANNGLSLLVRGNHAAIVPAKNLIGAVIVELAGSGC
jgi:hypothetical protein